MCEVYIGKTGLDDRWEADGACGVIWEAALECARRSCEGASACQLQWRRIYAFSFSVGGRNLALHMAEEAAQHFEGYAEMVAVVKEHRKARRSVDALRCKLKARVIESRVHAAAPAVHA